MIHKFNLLFYRLIKYHTCRNDIINKLKDPSIRLISIRCFISQIKAGKQMYLIRHELQNLFIGIERNEVQLSGLILVRGLRGFFLNFLRLKRK
jgi:hypothetical protein